MTNRGDMSEGFGVAQHNPTTDLTQESRSAQCAVGCNEDVNSASSVNRIEGSRFP
jgi:Lon protease-like protein